MDNSLKHNRLLCLLQMWKFFSHFGVRSLFVLYLVKQFQDADVHAFSLNAIFCSLVELGGVFGGMIADRYWGLKRTSLVGSVLLSLGYMGLIYEPIFFLSLGLIILGGSLFSSNITALLGSQFREDDSNRQHVFTQFYRMQNLGALAATLICSMIAMHYGFQWGFAVASSGMVMGNLTLLICYRDYSSLREEKVVLTKIGPPILGLAIFLGFALMSLYYAYELLFLLPWVTGGIFIGLVVYLIRGQFLNREDGYRLFLYLGGLIAFFAIEDQICSSLLLFAERQTDQLLFGWQVPSALITGLNPVIILGLGGWIARKKTQLTTPFMLTAGAFGILASLCLLHVPISLIAVMGCVAMISLAELMIAPCVLSYASKVAGKTCRGLIMGLVAVGFSLAFQLSGLLSKIVAIGQADQGSSVYGMGFVLIAVLMLSIGCLLFIAMKKTRSRVTSTPSQLL